MLHWNSMSSIEILNLIKLFTFLIELGRPIQSLGAALAKALSAKVFFVPMVNGCNKSSSKAVYLNKINFNFIYG